MHRFEFFGVGRIVFGRGQFARVGELAATLGRNPLVVYNGDEPGRGGALDHLTGAIQPKAIERQRGEPTVSDVDRILHTARTANCDCVIALGGGSAIDAAKAVAGLLGNGGAALDYMEVVGKGQKITQPALPWMAIPTTAGTGAEATRNAVIGYPEKQFKASIRSEMLLPRIALIDPEIQTSVPPNVTASSGMDALCQLIESYTSTGANPITQDLGWSGMNRVGRSLLRAFADGSDVDAREDMAMAALLSGITLTSAGLGAVHGFAAPLGAIFDVPHGVVCAALLPHVVEANIAALKATSPEHPALQRYAHVAIALTVNESMSGVDPLVQTVNSTLALVRELQIPPLGAFGIQKSHVPEMVALARKASSMRFNPVMLSDEALAGILERAL
jgi:alcohol dehydrogenase class IV